MEGINPSEIDVTISRAPLEMELQTFEALLPDLLEKNPGEWALIKDTELGGIFPERNDAIKAGYDKYGNQIFLTRQILEQQPELFYQFLQAA